MMYFKPPLKPAQADLTRIQRWHWGAGERMCSTAGRGCGAAASAQAADDGDDGATNGGIPASAIVA